MGIRCRVLLRLGWNPASRHGTVGNIRASAKNGLLFYLFTVETSPVRVIDYEWYAWHSNVGLGKRIKHESRKKTNHFAWLQLSRSVHIEQNASRYKYTARPRTNISAKTPYANPMPGNPSKRLRKKAIILILPENRRNVRFRENTCETTLPREMDVLIILE